MYLPLPYSLSLHPSLPPSIPPPPPPPIPVAYLDQVEASTLGFNVDKVIQNLTEFRDATTDTTLQAQADSLISDINAVASMADEIDSLVVRKQSFSSVYVQV